MGGGVCPPESELCPGSVGLYEALESCSCATCAASCSLTCTGQGQDLPDCQSCFQSAAGTECASQLAACNADAS